MSDPKVPDQKRAETIADIRAFADWLEQNPWVPTPFHANASEHLNGAGDRPDEQRAHLTRLRSVADRLGVKVDEHLTDRTRMQFNIGKFEYSLLVWHENGRPGEPDPRDAELEKLRAEVEALRADAKSPHLHDKGCSGAFGRPCVCATGAMTDGGPVDETVPAERPCPDRSGTAAERAFLRST
jgi:hypothetical protein